MAVFILPDFNLVCDYWIYPNRPAWAGPDHAGINAQLYFNSRNLALLSAAQMVRIPAFAVPAAKHLDILEMPAGSGNYYQVLNWFWIHKGFTNEYWMGEAQRCDAFSTSTPWDLP